jgi:predicted dienelactone hydrolase
VKTAAMLRGLLGVAGALTLASASIFGCSSGTAGAKPPLTAPASHGVTAPAPTDGPFAVGERTETFVDSTRKTPANGTTPEHAGRTLETLIMYPALGTPAPSHEPSAGAVPANGKFPLIVYAHGLGGGFESPFLRAWAAAGYVVAAPTFPLTRHDAPGGPNPLDAVNEPGDVSFVIGQMLRLPVRDAAVQRIVDAGEVGVVGASLGATVALTVAYNDCCQDARIKATVAISGGCPSACPHGAGPIEEPYGHSFTGPAIPLMLIHGTADPFAPYENSVEEFKHAPGPKFLVTLVGAKHIAFDEPWETVAVRSMIDFFDNSLKHEERALHRLRKDATVPRIARLREQPR